MAKKLKTPKAPAAKPASGHICTVEEAAALNFKPWSKDEMFQLPSLETIDNPHLIFCRLAYALMFKSKTEIVEMFKLADSNGDNIKILIVDRLEESKTLFEGLVTLLDAAHRRLLVAAASYVEGARST